MCMHAITYGHLCVYAHVNIHNGVGVEIHAHSCHGDRLERMREGLGLQKTECQA